MAADPSPLPPTELPFTDEPLELADLLNTVLDKGVVVHGDVTLAVADVDLVKLNLGLLLSAFATIEQRRPDRIGFDGAGTLARLFGPPVLERSPDASGTNPASLARPRASAGATPVPSGGSVPGPPVPADAALNDVARGLPERINTDPDRVESGLARLVLTLIEVLRKVLEHQAIRRMDGGTLSPEEVERLGLALSRLHGRMQELKAVFDLTDEDLQIDLGPLGRVR